MRAIRIALQLDESEWKWLETCVARCALDAAGALDAATFHHQDLLEISSASLRAAVELRAVGNSSLAASTTYPVARVLQDVLETSSVESVRSMFSVELCELLFHEAKCYLDYLPAIAISRIALPVANRLFECACQYPTARNRLLVGVLKEGLLYFDQRFREADDVARNLFAVGSDSEWQPEIIRAAAINAGHIGDEFSIRLHEREIRKLIASGVSSFDHVFMLEGLARGYARLGKVRAVDIIEEAWEVNLDPTVQSTLRYVQNVRAYLEVNSQLGRKNDNQMIVHALNGVRVARSMGYERYVNDLARLMEEAS